MHSTYAILSSVVRQDLNIFPHYVVKGTIFEKEALDIKCLFCLHNETFLILRRNERDVIKNVYLSSFKYPVFFLDFD